MNIKIEWDLSKLFAGDNDPKIAEVRAETERRVAEFKTKWAEQNLYLADPALLYQAISEFDSLMRDFGTGDRVGFYWHLRSVQDQNDSVVRGKLNEVAEWGTKLGNEVQFFPIRVARLSKEMREKVLADKKFAPYKHHLERAFAEADHILSEPEEKLMSLKSPVCGAWVSMTERLLSKEVRDGVPFSAMPAMLANKDKKIRDTAGAAMNEILAKLSDVAESEINAIFTDKKINDELRKFPRPDSNRHLSDDVETEVADALVAAVSKRNDISARYYALKAKLLGQTKLAYHERSIEYGKLPTGYSYEKAVELVSRVLGGLDAEFGEIFKRFIESSQLDALPRQGKEGGAFCSTSLLSTPTYIMLNFTGSLHDVQTIAHEVGHGINNELMRLKQNALNFGTPFFTAEVASTFMEDFVIEELQHEADDETRLALMMAKLNDDVSSIFRQVACYRFETELHRELRAKGYLSKEEIGKIFQTHMAAYMGPAVEQSAGSENWWVYWSHIRRYFYVYSYASGVLISKSLQHSVRQDKKFVSQVKEFLAAGMSDSPKNVFLKLGIDISNPEFWQNGLAEVEQLLVATEELAVKLGKI